MPGITPQHTITCANLGSTAVGMTCTMPGAGTVQPGGVTCRTVAIVTIPLPPGSNSPTRVVCPADTTPDTSTGASSVTTSTG
jgi:hypothetical protein